MVFLLEKSCFYDTRMGSELKKTEESKVDLNKFQMEIYLQERFQKTYKKEGNGSFKGMVQDTQLIDFWLIFQQPVKLSLITFEDTEAQRGYRASKQ